MSAGSADKPGRVKKELGEARRVRQAQTAEIEIYQYKLEKDFKYDVLEGCADAANITARAPEFGLMVFQPADLAYSWDLGTLADREQRKCASATCSASGADRKHPARRHTYRCGAPARRAARRCVRKV